MKINPYESPRPGDSADKQSFGDTESVRQLLIEIRDAQLEMLQIQRDAMQRQQRTMHSMRFSSALFLIPLAIMTVIPLIFTYRTVSSRPRPPTPVITPPPRATTPPVPTPTVTP
jgi:hypothetical protein